MQAVRAYATHRFAIDCLGCLSPRKWFNGCRRYSWWLA